MKNFLKLTKAIAVHALIFSLMQTSFIFSVQAASTNSSGMTSTEVTSKEILGVAQIAVQTYGQFLGQKQQMIAQQIAAQKNQALMQSLSPSCRKPDGTACYTVAGKFFPECPLPASMSSMPQNVCSAASPDPAAVSSMITYESIAKSWVNYFEQMQNEASNSATPFGMKCLEDKKKALDSQLTEMQNNLTRLQDQLNKDKETFKANNKKLLDDMKATNDELIGGATTNSLKAKTTDFSKFFSQSCQSVIGDDLKNIASQGGFVGIENSISAQNKSAADYNSNRTLIEADIRRDIDKATALINNGGIDDFLASNNKASLMSNGTTKYGSVASAIEKQEQEFALAKSRIQKELQKIGYTLPPIDKNFSVDFNTFLAGSTAFFEKQYVNDCVTGADKSGTAISTDQILASLQQKSTGSSGTARDKYKAALKTILNSDAFIEDKLAQIKALETNYKDITITYQNSSAQRVTTTPYDLYMKTLTACETKYKQDDTFSTSSAGVSQQTKVARGQDLLRELKGLTDNYTSQLGSRVLEQSLSCNGESKKAGDKCTDALNTTSDTFCMSKASQCANEIQGCYAEADKQVQTRKAKLEASAKTFNANTAALVARSNALYTAQKNAVMDMVKVVQARFPGTNFAIPADMFITMPEMKRDTFGVDMAGDGNLAFMDELPKKIDLLKKVFKDQQTAVDTEIADYVDKQKQAMETEKGKWNKLADDCTKNVDTSSREIAKMNNENLKKQAEMDGKVKSFCRKYSGLSTHPNGACDSAKSLSDTIDDVASRIVPTASSNVEEFNNVCNSLNNENNNADDPCNDPTERAKMGKAQRTRCEAQDTLATRRLTDEANPSSTGKKSKKGGKDITLGQLCENANTSNSDLVDKILSKLPKDVAAKYDDKDKKSKLADGFKTGDFDSVDGYNDDDFDDGGVFSALASVSGPADNVCANLLKVNAEKAKVSTPDQMAANKKAKDDLSNAQVAAKAASDAVKASKDTGDALKPLTDKATAADAAVVTAQKVADAAAAADTNIAPSEKKKDLIEALTALKTAGVTAPLSLAQTKAKAFKTMGEQIEANTTCDSQAANTNVAKGIASPWGLPAGFDNAVLGISK